MSDRKQYESDLTNILKQNAALQQQLVDLRADLGKKLNDKAIFLGGTSTGNVRSEAIRIRPDQHPEAECRPSAAACRSPRRSGQEAERQGYFPRRHLHRKCQIGSNTNPT